MHQLARFEQRCQRSAVLPLTDAIIVRAADIYALLYQRGQLISDADILIAATALQDNRIMVMEAIAHILFLCESSGDGQSEILTRYYERYNGRFQFYLDATHSFRLEQNAIQTLDDVFGEHKLTGKPLVVGINIGMLGNYAEEGNATHADIIGAIRAFLHGKTPAPQYRF